MSRISLEKLAPILPLVLTAHDAVQSRGDASYPFVQEANFLWLTSVEWAGWWYIATDESEYLVMPEIDESHELFDGSLSREEATKVSGIATILSRQEGKTLIESLARTHKKVFTLGKDPHASYYDFVENPAPKKLRKMLGEYFEDVGDCRKELAKLRACKSDK